MSALFAPSRRRALIALGTGLGAWRCARAAPATAPRALSLANLHTGETLRAVYWERGAYVDDALAAINHLMRDFRTGGVHPIDPLLLDVMHRLGASLQDGTPSFELISGYRSPRTNAMLHARSAGVATRSLHMQGMAADIRVGGGSLARLRDAALALGAGGVGFYPRSGFVHVDVGPPRRWTGS